MISFVREETEREELRRAVQRSRISNRAYKRKWGVVFTALIWLRISQVTGDCACALKTVLT